MFTSIWKVQLLNIDEVYTIWATLHKMYRSIRILLILKHWRLVMENRRGQVCGLTTDEANSRGENGEFSAKGHSVHTEERWGKSAQQPRHPRAGITPQKFVTGKRKSCCLHIHRMKRVQKKTSKPISKAGVGWQDKLDGRTLSGWAIYLVRASLGSWFFQFLAHMYSWQVWVCFEESLLLGALSEAFPDTGSMSLYLWLWTQNLISSTYRQRLCSDRK